MIRHYKTVFGETAHLSDENWERIVYKHPEVKKHSAKITEVLAFPDIVKISTKDKTVHLYYKYYRDIFDGKYLLIVTNSGKKAVITAFITDKIKVGELLWPKR